MLPVNISAMFSWSQIWLPDTRVLTSRHACLLMSKLQKLLQPNSLNFRLFTFQNSRYLRCFIAFLLQFYNCPLLVNWILIRQEIHPWKKAIPRDKYFVPRDGNPVPREKYPVPQRTINFPVIGTVGNRHIPKNNQPILQIIGLSNWQYFFNIS